MKYLLDTHIFLWALFEPEKLPKKIKISLFDSESTKYISIITFWEISLKFALSKIDLKGILPDELPKIARNDGFEILELHVDTVSSFYRLPKTNTKDPFDRMLAWQAINKDLFLLTKDPDFANYKDYGLKVLR